MKHIIGKFIAWLARPQSAIEEHQRRHEAWDRECRARGMTAREQQDELQLRCAWVRLRRKASEAAKRRPARYLESLDRIALDEARTLTAIGGSGLARVFWRALDAADPLDLLDPEAAAAVRAFWEKEDAGARLAPSLDDLAPAPRNGAAGRPKARRRRADLMPADER